MQYATDSISDNDFITFRAEHLSESKTVSFKITPELLRFYDYDLNHVAEPGDFDVMIGGSSQAEKTARLTLK